MYTAIMSNSYPTIDIAATGRNIRSLMAERGFGPVSVCEQFGIGSLQTVYNWMNGRNLPSIDHLYDLSMLLNVQIDDIIVSARRDGEYSSNEIMLGMAPNNNTVQPTIVSILRNGTLRVS
jgi:transcriptional regulator with XRE-family HTH domain